MIKSLKFFTLSLISTLSFMGFATADKAWVNIVNLDIPDTIKGVRKVTSKEVEFRGAHKAELPVPAVGEKLSLQSIEAGSYSRIGVVLETHVTNGGNMMMHNNCYLNNDKPLHISADKYTKENPLGISVGYNEKMDNVSCDITTPD